MTGLRGVSSAALRLGVLFLAVLLWALSCSFNSVLSVVKGTAVIHCNASLNFSDVNKMRNTEAHANNNINFTAWQQTDHQTIRHSEYVRVATADVVTVFGDTKLVFPVGQSLSAGDTAGCLLDKETAYNIFGTYKAAGYRLQYQNKTYIVRNVFASSEATLVIQADALSDVVFSKISLDVSQSAYPKRAAEEFASRYNLTDFIVEDNGMYSGAATFFAALPAWILAAALLLIMLREAYRYREMPVRFMFYLLVGAVILIVYFLVSGLRFSFPQSMVPTRWSDFEFWQRLFMQNKQHTLQMLYMKKEKPAILLIQLAAKAIGSSLVTVLLLWYTVKKHRVSTAKNLFNTVFFYFLITFFAVLLAQKFVPSAASFQMLWVCIPFFYAVRFYAHT